MRRYISFVTLVVILFCGISCTAKTEYSVTSSTVAKMSTVQGTDGWYFAAFPDGVRENLVYYPDATRWKMANGEQYPTVKSDLMMPGNTIDCGYVYEVKTGGVVRLKGSVVLNSASVEMSISKNGTKTVWSKKESASKNTKKEVEYELLTVVKPGDELWFKVGADGANTNDFTTWWPSVEYTSLEYVPIEDEDINLEYNYDECFDEDSLWSLKYKDKSGYDNMIWDNREERYIVKSLSGDAAYVDKNAMKPTGSCSVSSVWTSPYSGTISVNALVTGLFSDNSVTDVKIIKNAELDELSETVWKARVAGDGSVNCEASLPVTVGDSIYFSAECVSGLSGGISFKPSIKYTQSVIFTEDGEILKSMIDVEEGDNVYAELRGNGDISGGYILMLALYDADGNMRSLSTPETVNASDSTGSKIYKGVTMDFNKASYEGWKLSILMWSVEDGRIYSVRQSGEIALK